MPCSSHITRQNSETDLNLKVQNLLQEMKKLVWVLLFFYIHVSDNLFSHNERGRVRNVYPSLLQDDDALRSVPQLLHQRSPSVQSELPHLRVQADPVFGLRSSLPHKHWTGTNGRGCSGTGVWL